jgi:hypothetical protein
LAGARSSHGGIDFCGRALLERGKGFAVGWVDAGKGVGLGIGLGVAAVDVGGVYGHDFCFLMKLAANK